MTYKELAAVDTTALNGDELRAHLMQLGKALQAKKMSEDQYNQLLNKALGINESERDHAAEAVFERRRQ